MPPFTTLPEKNPANKMGSEKETTHQNKGCTSTKGADGSSSVDGKWQMTSGLTREAHTKWKIHQITKLNKNMTNDKGCRIKMDA